MFGYSYFDDAPKKVDLLNNIVHQIHEARKICRSRPSVQANAAVDKVLSNAKTLILLFLEDELKTRHRSKQFRRQLESAGNRGDCISKKKSSILREIAKLNLYNHENKATSRRDSLWSEKNYPFFSNQNYLNLTGGQVGDDSNEENVFYDAEDRNQDYGNYQTPRETVGTNSSNASQKDGNLVTWATINQNQKNRNLSLSLKIKPNNIVNSVVSNSIVPNYVKFAPTYAEELPATAMNFGNSTVI